MAAFEKISGAFSESALSVLLHKFASSQVSAFQRWQLALRYLLSQRREQDFSAAVTGALLSHSVCPSFKIRSHDFPYGLQFPFLFASSPCGSEEHREAAVPQPEWNAVANFSPPKKLDHPSCIQPTQVLRARAECRQIPLPIFRGSM